MSEISPKDVMKLRNETGLPMMECKKALMETGGDAEAATELLRKKMKGKMEKRSDRAAGEGRIGVATNDGSGVAAIVEIRAETDFTAKNEKFVDAVSKIANLALEANAGSVEANDVIGAIIDDLRITTGENISFARGHKITGETGTTAYGTYVHHDGKTGVLIQAEGSVGEDTLRQVCMHIAAAPTPPLGVTTDDIPADVIEKEKAFRISQAEESGKPREIAEKIVEGGMRKFFEEVALIEQPFIMDESKKVKDVVGKDANLIQFFRWQVGG